MAHAILSPSAASRWLSCTPSARLEQTFPDNSGEAAKEGTLAHSVGETILRTFYGLISKQVSEDLLTEMAKSKYYSEDLKAHAEDYAAFVVTSYEDAKSITKDAVLLIEHELNLTDYVPEGFGTGDAIIIADGTLEIIDLKYGKGVRVECTGNKQMKLYALGALREFDFMYDIHTVRMTIYQPRLSNISSWELPVSELREWATHELTQLAEMAFKGMGDYIPGEHCRFCKARAQCKANADEQMKLAAYDFKDSYLLSDEEISDILTRASSFKNWLSNIEEFAFLSALNDGKKWPGYKLVEGRSNRVYTDPIKVASTLIDAGFQEDLIYVRNLLGITAMEKTITKKMFDSLLSPLVIKPAGKPTLVPADDKRPEWNSADTAITDFQ